MRTPLNLLTVELTTQSTFNKNIQRRYRGVISGGEEIQGGHVGEVRRYRGSYNVILL